MNPSKEQLRDLHDAIKRFCPDVYAVQVVPAMCIANVHQLSPKRWPYSIANRLLHWTIEPSDIGFNRGRVSQGSPIMTGVDLERTHYFADQILRNAARHFTDEVEFGRSLQREGQQNSLICESLISVVSSKHSRLPQFASLSCVPVA